jgi:hypothetical protein
MMPRRAGLIIALLAALAVAGCGSTRMVTVIDPAHHTAAAHAAPACITINKTGQHPCGPEARGYCEATANALPEIGKLIRRLVALGGITQAQLDELRTEQITADRSCGRVGVALPRI